MATFEAPQASELTAEVLSDLLESPYLAPVVSALQRGATIVGNTLSALVDTARRNSHFAATTPTAQRFLQSVTATAAWLTELLSGTGESSLFGDRGEEAGPAFKGTPEEVQAHYSRQWYLSGDRCVPGHGAPRRTEVVLECGMHAEITDVVETQVGVLPFLSCS